MRVMSVDVCSDVAVAQDRVGDLLGIQVQMCSVDLIESPQEIFGSSIDVISSRVIWEIGPERTSF